MYEEIAATSVHSNGAWWHSRGQEAAPEAIMLTQWVRGPWVLCHGCSLLQHCSPPQPQQPQQEEKASPASEPPPCFNLGGARPERSSRACPPHATKQKAANPLWTLGWPLKWLNAPSLPVDKLWCFAIPLSNYWPCSQRWLGLVCANSQALMQGLWDLGWKEMGKKGWAKAGTCISHWEGIISQLSFAEALGGACLTEDRVIRMSHVKAALVSVGTGTWWVSRQGMLWQVDIEARWQTNIFLKLVYIILQAWKQRGWPLLPFFLYRHCHIAKRTLGELSI